MVIRGKIRCPLIKVVRFLEYPLIRDFTFVSFSFCRAWAGHQSSFFRTTSLLVFLVLKTILPLWYDGQWVKWGGKNLELFFISEGKTTHWQQDHLHNFIIFIKYPMRVSLSQTIRKEITKILGTCGLHFPAILWPRPSYFQKFIRKIYLYKKKSLCVNKSMFFIFFRN